jgi:predicted nucleic acid-binding Zn ribbon protein
MRAFFFLPHLTMNPSLRSSILSDWRGLPQKEPRPDRTKSVADSIKDVLLKLGLKERLTEAEIIEAWKEIVGDFIATHSVPSRLRDGVLFVQVIQSTVHYELDRVWKPDLIKKLKARFGARTIRDVKFRIG